MEKPSSVSFSNWRVVLPGKYVLLIGAVAVIVAAALAGMTLAPLVGPRQTASVTAPQGEIERVVRDYLLAHPEVLFEAIERHQRKQEDQRLSRLSDGIKSHAKALFEATDGLVAGNPKGDVTVVEFFDYQCPYCKKVRPEIDALLKQDGNIKLVLKEFPILSVNSQLAARAAIASAAQGKYWDFHLALMGADDLSADNILRLAKGTGLNVVRLQADMNDAKVQQRITANHLLARELGIDSTPMFVVGDQSLIGAQTLEQLKEAVQRARKVRPS